MTSTGPAATGSALGFNAVADAFANTLKAAFDALVAKQPEDQLKSPMQELLRDGGALLGHAVVAVTGTQITGLGARPDIGVTVGGLLTGHVELKAPGRGARPIFPICTTSRAVERRTSYPFSATPTATRRTSPAAC